MEALAKTSLAIAVGDSLTTLIDWTDIEVVSGFTLIIENSSANGDDITDIQLDTSDDGGKTISLDQHSDIFADPIAAAESKKETFTETAKFVRIRALCATGKSTTATAYLLADTVVGRLCTLDDIKDRLAITTTDYDIMINRIIAGIDGLFESYTLRKLLLNPADETIYTTGRGRKLLLPRFPIVSITSVTETDDYDFEGDAAQALVADTDYRLIDNKILYRINTVWNPIEDGIRIIYRGGYTSAGQTVGGGEFALPDDLREAAILQASFVYKRRNDIGLTSISVTGGSIDSFSAMDLLPMVKMTLEKYRRLVI